MSQAIATTSADSGSIVGNQTGGLSSTVIIAIVAGVVLLGAIFFWRKK